MPVYIGFSRMKKSGKKITDEELQSVIEKCKVAVEDCLETSDVTASVNMFTPKKKKKLETELETVKPETAVPESTPVVESPKEGAV